MILDALLYADCNGQRFKKRVMWTLFLLEMFIKQTIVQTSLCECFFTVVAAEWSNAFMNNSLMSTQHIFLGKNFTTIITLDWHNTHMCTTMYLQNKLVCTSRIYKHNKKAGYFSKRRRNRIYFKNPQPWNYIQKRVSIKKMFGFVSDCSCDLSLKF